MRTEKQIEASRINGAKSRGPVTAEGKAISSQNATRHGFLSRRLLIRGEREEAFLELITGLCDEFQPVTDFEQSLVDDMATARWRQMRLQIMEGALFDYEGLRECVESANPDPQTRQVFGAAFRSLVTETRCIDVIVRYNSSLAGQYLRAHKRLTEVQNARLKNGFGDFRPIPGPRLVGLRVTDSSPIDQHFEPATPTPSAPVTPDPVPAEPSPAPAPSGKIAKRTRQTIEITNHGFNPTLSPSREQSGPGESSPLPNSPRAANREPGSPLDAS